jgi:hypothetical protein
VKEPGAESRDVSKQVDWAAVARWLLSESPDFAINLILAELGRKHGGDRGWMIRYNPEFTHFWNSHEWVRPGVQPFLRELQGIPVVLAGWLHERLCEGEPAAVEDVLKIPPRAKAFRAEMQRQRIKSILSVPIMWEGKLVIQFGLDMVEKKRAWDDAVIADFVTAGELIGLRLFQSASGGQTVFPPYDPVEPLVYLTQGEGTFAVFQNELIWVESQGNYTRVHLRDGRSVLELKPLRVWESQLPPERFVRVHRSALVNVAQLESLERGGGDWKIRLRDRAEFLPVGRSYRAALRHHMAI